MNCYAEEKKSLEKNIDYKQFFLNRSQLYNIKVNFSILNKKNVFR